MHTYTHMLMHAHMNISTLATKKKEAMDLKENKEYMRRFGKRNGKGEIM